MGPNHCAVLGIHRASQRGTSNVPLYRHWKGFFDIVSHGDVKREHRKFTLLGRHPNLAYLYWFGLVVCMEEFKYNSRLPLQ